MHKGCAVTNIRISVLSTILWYSPVFRCSSNNPSTNQRNSIKYYVDVQNHRKVSCLQTAWSIKLETGLRLLSLVQVQQFSKSTDAPYFSFQATSGLLAAAETLNCKGLCTLYACCKTAYNTNLFCTKGKFTI